ncbi:MAG: Rieske (2Fe-2S) protein [Vicinamibacterales bacterium]|nr:Rieske (2Fe-2S) protein [Vicinamibacterales bacterium]
MPQPPVTRRDALRGLAVVAAGLAAACDAAPVPPEAVVPLADLAAGRRVRVLVGGKPVEVVSDAGAIHARYLVCTHMGCLVTWHEDRERYVCACHDGLFTRSGRPVGGPATEPLVEVPFTLEAGEVVFRRPGGA